MAPIPEFTDYELQLVRGILARHYKKDVEIELADCEFLTDKTADNSTSCPTVFWYEQGANFVVFKIAPLQYRTQFFYTPHDKFGTETEEYADLEQCVTGVLTAQLDQTREIQHSN